MCGNDANVGEDDCVGGAIPAQDKRAFFGSPFRQRGFVEQSVFLLRLHVLREAASRFRRPDLRMLLTLASNFSGELVVIYPTLYPTLSVQFAGEKT